MKKFLSLIIIFLSLFLIPISSFSAATYTGNINGTTVYVRSGPGTNYSKLGTYDFGKSFDMDDRTLYGDQGGCPSGWYRVVFDSAQYGYVCSLYLTVTTNASGVTDANFEAYIKSAFPESYWSKLIALHSIYPNWQFEPIYTGLDWYASVSAQATGNVSLINTKYDGYKSTAADSYNWLSDTFKVFEGSSWYAASPDVVAYYLDPRNFLNEKNIFMFEKLNFDASYQTTDTIKSVFTSSSYLNNYVNSFYQAGQTYNANPIYLASRVRLETGNNGGRATSGEYFTYENKSYSGLYNMYNIGASSSASNPVLAGLVWANGGSDGSTKTYLRPWRSIDTSIKGGAWYITEKYIAVGQYTNYLQRFNVDPSVSNKHRHQYMTNIQAPATESTSTYNSYANEGLLSTAFKFAIPVFNNMPSSTAMPNTGNPNNRLKDLKVNGNTLNGFSHDKNTYDYYVSDKATSVVIAASVINGNAKVSNTGTISLTAVKTPINVVVTAENGKTNTYTINVIKTDSESLTADDIINNMPVKSDGSSISGLSIGYTADSLLNLIQKESPIAEVTIKNSAGAIKTSGRLGTGDTVTIKNGNSSKSFTVVIYGDISSTGEVTVLDLLKVQKHIKGASTLSGNYLKAADANRDGQVNSADLLRIQKHILGLVTIVQ